jgi:hypothetical protein
MPFELTPSLCHYNNLAINLHLYILVNLGIRQKCHNTFRGTVVDPLTNLLIWHLRQTSTCWYVSQKNIQPFLQACLEVYVKLRDFIILQAS